MRKSGERGEGAGQLGSGFSHCLEFPQLRDATMEMSVAICQLTAPSH